MALPADSRVKRAGKVYATLGRLKLPTEHGRCRFYVPNGLARLLAMRLQAHHYNLMQFPEQLVRPRA